MKLRQFFITSFRNINLRKYVASRFQKKFLPVTILAAAIVAVITTTVIVIVKAQRKSADTRVEVQGAKARQDINAEFPISIKNSKGEEAAKIKMELQSAELRDEIIVAGKRATSVRGRTFLILNLKLTSDFSQSIEINVRNYFRLTTNGKEAELLAADIHNDPVLIQPQSTKYTRIGFPINDTDKQLVLWEGDVSSQKQKVELNLRWINTRLSPYLKI